MSHGIVLAEVGGAFPRHRCSFLCCFIGFVIAEFVQWVHQPLVDHCLCDMAFDLGDGDGVWLFRLHLLVVQLPHVAILLQCPWSFGYCALANVLVKLQGFVSEGLAVSAYMDWPWCSHCNDGSRYFHPSGGPTMPLQVGVEL